MANIALLGFILVMFIQQQRKKSFSWVQIPMLPILLALSKKHILPMILWVVFGEIRWIICWTWDMPQITSFVPCRTWDMPQITSFVPCRTWDMPQITSFIPCRTWDMPQITSFVPCRT
ncbi:MAG: hypothetical protein JNM36_18555 [Chitinophagales bacterium]|nr:hypothetical protein [Chitinophagales bacterium]